MPLPEALGFVFIVPGTAPGVAYTILVLQAMQLNKLSYLHVQDKP
jgi:hypothetical protein